jgi:hypothetical protein
VVVVVVELLFDEEEPDEPEPEIVSVVVSDLDLSSEFDGLAVNKKRAKPIRPIPTIEPN